MKLGKAHWERLRWANIAGIIDSHGAVDSRLSPLGKGLIHHESVWPMKSAGKWRWNFDRSIYCFCDTLNAEEYAAVQSHLTKKYGLRWWENGFHDIDHIVNKLDRNHREK